jgi:hypothetical protein
MDPLTFGGTPGPANGRCADPRHLRACRAEVQRWMVAMSFPLRLETVCTAILCLAHEEPLTEVFSPWEDAWAEGLTGLISHYLWPMVQAVYDVEERWQEIFEGPPDGREPAWHPVQRLGFEHALTAMIADDFVGDFRDRLEAQYVSRAREAPEILQPDLLAGEGP